MLPKPMSFPPEVLAVLNHSSVENRRRAGTEGRRDNPGTVARGGDGGVGGAGDSTPYATDDGAPVDPRFGVPGGIGRGTAGAAESPVETGPVVVHGCAVGVGGRRQDRRIGSAREPVMLGDLCTTEHRRVDRGC